MARKTRRRGAPPPPRKQKTKWQLTRDRALLDAGYTKADVHRETERLYGAKAPALTSVRAVLEGRYRDAKVMDAFAGLLVGYDSDDNLRARRRYFPDDEPPYRGPLSPDATRPA